MPENKHLRFAVIVFYIAASLIGAYFFMRFLLPCLLPFILAYLTAAAIEPAVRHLSESYRIKRSFCSAVCTVIAFLALTGLISAAMTHAAYEVTKLIRELPEALSGTLELIEKARELLSGAIKTVPDSYRDFAFDTLDSVKESFAQLPVRLTSVLMSALSSLAAAVPGVFLFTVTYTLGVFAISSTYPQIRKFIIRQIPPKYRPGARGLKSDLVSTIIKWLRAQLILSLITFLQLAIGFSVAGIASPVLMALVTAAVDALPVFGAGAVLLPWSAFSFIGGRRSLAAALLIIYAAVSLVRRFLEPHIVSASLGLHPVAALLSIYTGFRIAGIWGMISFPLALILICRLNSSGQLSLWK